MEGGRKDPSRSPCVSVPALRGSSPTPASRAAPTLGAHALRSAQDASSMQAAGFLSLSPPSPPLEVPNPHGPGLRSLEAEPPPARRGPLGPGMGCAQRGPGSRGGQRRQKEKKGEKVCHRLGGAGEGNANPTGSETEKKKKKKNSKG